MPPGTIDNLNFEVLLDDSKFVKKVKDDIDLAEKLNTTLSTALKITGAIPDAKKIFDDNEAKKIRDIASAVKDLKGDLKGIEDGVTVVKDEVDKTAPAVDNANKSLGNTSDLMRTIAQLTGVAFSVATIRRFATELIETTGAFEVQKMALTSMLQDADKADEIFNTLRKNALESPYTFQDLAKFAKQLTAFNIPADQLVETEKRLADVAAGLGVDVGRIILAYGQVKAAGVLKGTELRQFTEAGVPVLEQLAKQIEEVEGRTISLSEVFQRVTKKEISFEMVEEAFRRMTSEGGKFYNMQDVLVQTLQGKIGKLRDVWQQALYDMGTNNEKLLKGAVDAVTNLVSHLEDVGKIIPEIVAAFGAFKTIQIILDGVKAKTLEAFLANHKLLSSLKAIGDWIAKNPYALLGAIIAGLVVGIVNAVKKTQELKNQATAFIRETDKEIGNEIDKLDLLDAKLRLAKKGTQEWNDAKKEVVSTYGKYFSGLDAEIEKVGSLATTYDNLKTSIEQATRERSYLEFKKQEEDWVSGINEKNLAKLSEKVYGKYSPAQAYTIMTAVRDALKNGGSIADVESFAGGSVSGIIGGNKSVRKLIEEVLQTASQGRNKMLYDLRQAVAALGLRGTELDPDFIGPLMPSPSTTTPKPKNWGDANAADRAAKERISDLQREVTILERYLNIRKELEREFFGGDTTAASDWMGKVTGKESGYFSGLETSIGKAVTELRTLGDAGNDAADAIEGRLGTDALSVAKKQLQDNKKAAEEYERAEKKISEYLSKNFGTEGEKTAAKISKLLADLATANAKADNTVKNLTDTLDKEKEAVVKKYLETIKDNGLSEEEQKKLADAYWKEYRTERIKEIKAQAQQEKDYNNRNTREAIRGQAKALFNQQMFGYDLSHWSDKTLSQILEIEDALKNLEIPQDVREELEGNKDALEALKKELKALAESALQKTVTPEKWKKVAEMTKDVSSNVASLSDSLEGLGDAMNDSGIKGFASALKTAASYSNTISDAFTGLMQASANGAEWGGVWGFIIAFGTQFLSTIIDLTAKSQQEAAALRDRYKEVGDAIKEAYHNSQIENFADALERAGDSLFGDNALARVARATRELQSLREQIAAMSSIAGFTTISQNGVNYGSISLEAAARQSGMALYDENNNYNAKLLNWIKDQGWDLTEEELDWLNRQIELSTNYAKALESIEDALGSLVNNVASDAADKLVDQWIEAGNAALDYADILDDVAKSYAKMLIQSTIMENFLDPITDDLKAAFIGGRYEDAMSILAGAMQNIQNSAPVFENILKAFDPYFKAAEGSDDSSSVGKGIKSITEETASLLASYLNAIRADVSYMRSMAESGWLNVENIARAITPNLADYVQQIAANTYNTAENTATILSELQSVIGAPGATSPMVLRVEMA